MEDRLTAKLGPFQVWVWGVILGLLILGYMLWSRHMSGGAAPATSTVDTGTALPDVSGAGLGAASGGGSTSSGTSSDFDTNQLWESRALTALAGKGISPLTAQLAIENYLAGGTLTFDQQKILNSILGVIGLPPQGTAGTPVLSPPPAPPKPAPVPAPAPKPHKPTTGHVPPPKPAPPKTRTHIVKKGETLSEISLHFYGHSTPALWEKIARANHITNVNVIRTGQHLVIPA